jgi:hypothetical protein
MGGALRDLGHQVGKGFKQVKEGVSDGWDKFKNDIAPDIMPKPPQMPEIPTPPSADDIAQSFLKFSGGEPDNAATVQKKKSKGAGGLADDKLTGAKGLGEVGAENKERKVLLGY